MERLAKDNSLRANWSLLCTNMALVKSCAENLLFLTGFAQGIPKVMRMLSFSTDGTGSFLKPLEIFLGTMKDTGSFVEAFEKVPPLIFGRVTKRESGCLYWGRRADAIAAGIEGFIMIPYRANLLYLGRFAGALGGLKIIKDSLALVAIGCGFHVAGKRIERNSVKIEECQIRMKILEKVELLVKKNSWTDQELREIDRLKRIYQRRRKDPEEKMRILHSQWQKENRLIDRQRLEKEWAAMKEKAYRHKVWTHPFIPREVDLLRNVVSHKIVSRKMRMIRAEKRIELAKAERRHSVSISILIALGLVAQIGLFTMGSLTGSLLFLGQWIASLTTGTLGFGKIAATLRYKSVVRNSATC